MLHFLHNLDLLSPILTTRCPSFYGFWRGTNLNYAKIFFVIWRGEGKGGIRKVKKDFTYDLIRSHFKHMKKQAQIVNLAHLFQKNNID
jgi:hypothetical protein